MSAPTIDDVAATLAEYEAAAIATGEWAGAEPPEFSADGVTWSPFWLGDEPPALVRATVHRRGVNGATVSTTVVVAWRESIPADESWRALWLAKPMKLSGAYTLRASIRRGFRDAVGMRRDSDEPTDVVGAWAAPDVPRDWLVELAAAWSEDAVHALHAAAKKARAVTARQGATGIAEGAFRERLNTIRNSGAAIPNVAPVADPVRPAPVSAGGDGSRTLPPAPDAPASGSGERPAPSPSTVPHAPRAADAKPPQRKPRRAQSTGLTRPIADELRDAVARHNAEATR